MAGGKFWSEDDIEFLRKNYDSMTKDQLALVLGRTKIAIGMAATKIGVKKSAESFSKSISETRKKQKLEIESLRQQLSDSQKKVVMLREFLPYAVVVGYEMEQKYLKALAATEPKP